MKRRAQIMRHVPSRAASKGVRQRAQKRTLRPKTKTKPGSVAKTARKSKVSKGGIKIARKLKASNQPPSSSIVRIMGRGQYKVNARTLKHLNQVDDAMVSMMSNEKPDDIEFKRRLAELTEIVVRDGEPLNGQGITKSDIILPSADLPIDNAKKLFMGEGVIPRF